MATELIDRFTGEWKPAKYKDTYREALIEGGPRQAQGEGDPRRGA